MLECLEPQLQGNWQLLVTNLLDSQSRQVHLFGVQGSAGAPAFAKPHISHQGAGPGQEGNIFPQLCAGFLPQPGRTIWAGGVGRLAPGTAAVPWALAGARVSVDRWMQEAGVRCSLRPPTQHSQLPLEAGLHSILAGTGPGEG